MKVLNNLPLKFSFFSFFKFSSSEFHNCCTSKYYVEFTIVCFNKWKRVIVFTRKSCIVFMSSTCRSEIHFKYLGKFIMVIIMHQYASLEFNKIFDLQNN